MSLSALYVIRTTEGHYFLSLIYCRFCLDLEKIFPNSKLTRLWLGCLTVAFKAIRCGKSVVEKLADTFNVAVEGAPRGLGGDAGTHWFANGCVCLNNGGGYKALSNVGRLPPSPRWHDDFSSDSQYCWRQQQSRRNQQLHDGLEESRHNTDYAEDVVMLEVTGKA